MKYALLIHGPFSTEYMSQIKAQVENFKKGFNQIVLVSYQSDYKEYFNLLKSLKFNDVNIVVVKDTLNPGFFNINRQISCVNKGLMLIDNDSYVFKLRSDQSVDFNKVVKYEDNERIITTNCYSRRDRLYHPSDMFLCGRLQFLKEMYSLSAVPETHLMTEYKNKRAYKENPKLDALPISPESILCRHYLKQKNWNFKETKTDSFEALKKYYLILNSWNIDFEWGKKRRCFFLSGHLILPSYFNNISPIEGVPPEHASCYTETDFNKKLPSVKDMYYIFLSKLHWRLVSPVDSVHKFKNKIVKKMKGIQRLKL